MLEAILLPMMSTLCFTSLYAPTAIKEDISIASGFLVCLKLVVVQSNLLRIVVISHSIEILI